MSVSEAQTTTPPQQQHMEQPHPAIMQTNSSDVHMSSIKYSTSGGRGRGHNDSDSGVGRSGSESGRGGGRGRGGRGRGRGPGRGIGRGSTGRGRGRGPGRGRGRNPNDGNVVSDGDGNSFNNNKDAPVCTFFLQNRCNHGSTCRFYHPAPPDTNGVCIPATNTNSEQEQEKKSRPSAPPYTSYPKRAFDAHKFKAITLAKQAQDDEPRPYQNLVGPFFSMDIECVATGYGYSKSHRSPCRVALVKDNGKGEGEIANIEMLLNVCVNLEKLEVVSYMTELTGTTEQECLGPDAKDLDHVRSMVKELLPSDAVLVGHSIQHDCEWLGLVEGVDFRECFDTSIIFRQRIPKNLGSAGNALRQIEMDVENSMNALNDASNNNNSADDGKSTNANGDDNECIPAPKPTPKPTPPVAPARDIINNGPDDSNVPIPTRYRVFSLRHTCINMLNIDMQENAHDPVMDAKYSLLLFHKYRKAPIAMLRAVRDSLHRSPATASFASGNPVLDGVVLSPIGYKMKGSARFIWRWWVGLHEK